MGQRKNVVLSVQGFAVDVVVTQNKRKMSSSPKLVFARLFASEPKPPNVASGPCWRSTCGLSVNATCSSLRFGAELDGSHRGMTSQITLQQLISSCFRAAPNYLFLNSPLSLYSYLSTALGGSDSPRWCLVWGRTYRRLAAGRKPTR